MKIYSYIIIVLVLAAFTYLAIQNWSSRPMLVALFGVLSLLILIRVAKSLKQ